MEKRICCMESSNPRNESHLDPYVASIHQNFLAGLQPSIYQDKSNRYTLILYRGNDTDDITNQVFKYT